MFGQKWEKLPGGYHLLSTNNDSPNMSATDPSNHIPGEAAQGGLPNISGSLSGLYGWEWSASGAFSKSWAGKGPGGSSYANCYGGVDFKASRSSNRYGTYQGSGDKVIGDHIAAVMWKRIA